MNESFACHKKRTLPAQIDTRSPLCLNPSNEYPWGYPKWLHIHCDHPSTVSPATPIEPWSTQNPSCSLDIPFDESHSISRAVEYDSNHHLSRRISLPTLLSRSTRVSRILTEASLSTINIENLQSSQPQSITRVNPAHIKLIGCMGDSLLTGLGVSAQPTTFKNKILGSIGKISGSYVSWIASGEHRQNTCITGAGPGVLSVGRLLQHFSSDIVGLTFTKTPLFSKGSSFNMARTGATSDQLLQQARRFVDQLRSPQFRALNDKWKLVFIWIGSNDVLMHKNSAIEKDFKSNVIRTLDFLKANMAKTIVSLLTLPDICTAASLGVSASRHASLESKCAFVNESLFSIVHDQSWNTPDFAVIIQPIPADNLGKEALLPFISELDHMHPNFFAQQLFSKCIWNNLFSQEHEKLCSFDAVVKSEWMYPLDVSYIALN